MPDSNIDWIIHIIETLESAGFEKVMAEAVPVPDHILPELENPEAAEHILYFKARTNLGKFGFMPTEDGMAIDLKDLGLTLAGLHEKVRQTETNKDGYLAVLRDPDDLADLREFLEERRNRQN